MDRALARVTAAATALVGVAAAAVSVTLAEAPDRLDRLVILAVVTTYLAVALALRLAGQGRVGRLLLAGAAMWGVGEGALALGVEGLSTNPGSVPGAAWLGVLGTAVRGLGWLLLVLAVPLYFPDGKSPWPSRAWPGRLLATSLAGFVLATLLAPRPLETTLGRFDSPTGLPERFRLLADVLALSAVGASVATLAVAVAGLWHRWRVGDPLRRQQLLWFGLAFAVPLAFLPLIATELVAPWMFGVVVLPVPFAIAAALFQRRLYDVELVVSRGVTWVLLSAAVAGLYAVTVGGVGALVGRRGEPWLGYVAAAVVAVSFAPLHATLRRAVSRVTYGQWSEPVEVLAATGRRLQDASDAPALLATLVTEIATGLDLDAVWITDSRGRVLAARGAPGDPTGGAALTAYGLPVGRLDWRGAPLRAGQERLLVELAGQVGAVVHGAGLVESLRAARQRLVLAREEERRRLRRDLHDGLGPELAALTMQVDALRNRVGAEPADARAVDLDAELVRLRSGIQATVQSVRRVVEGLRPPALDELGIAGALEQLVEGMPGGPVITVDLEPVDRLNAAAEVAVYRVAQEALANAVRHSGSARARLSLHTQGDRVVLTVSDEGRGGAAPREGGVGLGSMTERAVEVGGTLDVRHVLDRGTVVTLSVPLEGSRPRAEVVR